ncbi:MAG TPA: hypothetical protein IAA98_09675 [Candidatus Avipropionibacterium avicola]|uniref:DUF1700 domain-containing protein n=1 Tax=Candidatus Avipropionibacterium avicola TaxID=2840701 RepID=A0A9D1KNZ9_9ACTN|nr:hypothetical protein [Candidatus Avipropionibacterium avicola]
MTTHPDVPLPETSVPVPSITDLPTPARDWLTEVERGLGDADEADRREVVDGFRAHLGDALAEGREVDDVLTSLGSSRTVIAQTRQELGLGERRDPAATASRILALATVGLSLLTTIVMILIAPARSVRDGEVVWTLLTQGMDPWTTFVCILPTVAASLLVLASRTSSAAVRTGVTLGVAVALSAWVLLAMASVGWFWMPTALTAWLCLVVPWRMRSARHPSRGIGWVVAAVLPAVCVLTAVATGTVQLGGPGSLLPLLVPLVAALCLSIRSRLTSGLVIIAGLAVMTIGVVSADLLMLGFWVVGGCYVALGCGRWTQAVQAPARRPFAA